MLVSILLKEKEEIFPKVRLHNFTPKTKSRFPFQLETVTRDYICKGSKETLFFALLFFFSVLMVEFTRKSCLKWQGKIDAYFFPTISSINEKMKKKNISKQISDVLSSNWGVNILKNFCLKYKKIKRKPRWGNTGNQWQ